MLCRKELAAADTPDEMRKTLMDEYKDAFANPMVAASRGYIDDIIEPSETRAVLASCLEILKSKREIRPQKKHGLIPM